ncbi:hypothetical protein Drose_37085 [Dactylosporangium roseum]|uniref:Glycosyltransferase 2-like domain-containing protein n=1 Tax=Dactylosporangium roseum TaxID=47989 RepID=A0ABY5Z3F6_9ACTN|nr:hypothetical protein [Dactylosporangium roseum]UWZ36564.1 hypothetical protein Drose_37085 [Dactylosporangium roseum]
MVTSMAAIAVLCFIARRLPVLFRMYRVGRRLARTRRAGFEIRSDWVILVPAWAEPEAAVTAWRFWKEQSRRSGVNFALVLSEHDSESQSVLTKALAPADINSSESVLIARGTSKAELITASAIGLGDVANGVMIFDSDSRPRGVIDVQCAVMTIPSVYKVTTACSFLLAGSAAWQTCWSLGFEHGMASRRRMWYVVGHGIGVEGRRLLDVGLSSDVLAEDLLLGYRLSEILPPEEVFACDTALDVAQWPAALGEQTRMVARWFWGDVQAAWSRLSARPIGATLRVSELFITWLLGPIVGFFGFILLLVEKDFAQAAAAAGAFVVLSVAPAVLLGRDFLPVDSYQDAGTYPRASGRLSDRPLGRLFLIPGLIARPVLDAAGILLHARLVLRRGGTRPPTAKQNIESVHPTQDQA